MPLLVTVSRESLIGLGKPPTGPIYRKFLQIAAKVDTTAKHKLSNDVVNVRTGNLRSSQQFPTVVCVGSKIVGTCVNVASYATFIHEGTRPHEITPRKSGGILTGWTYGGAPVFTPLVNHPGTKARPWMRDALTEVIRSTR